MILLLSISVTELNHNYLGVYFQSLPSCLPYICTSAMGNLTDKSSFHQDLIEFVVSLQQLHVSGLGPYCPSTAFSELNVFTVDDIEVVGTTSDLCRIFSTSE